MSRRRWTSWCIGASLVLALVMLAGCGASVASTASNNAAHTTQQSNQPGSTTGRQITYAPAATAVRQSNNAGPQYLIKEMTISMTFADTRKVAADLQTWIASTDPQSTSAGTTYEQVSNNAYHITMTFSVAASAYPHIFSYLAGYAQTHNGHLINLHETVQDVSNQYVDAQSRLKNLRAEQERLLALMKQATTLNDTLTLEQRLTDVEGQIEQIEAQLNALNGQTTYYKVTITLDPIGNTPNSPQSSPDTSWDLGQTIHDAFTAATGFGQGLLSLLIWLAFFAVYLVPPLVLYLVIRRLMRARAARHAAPAVAPASARTIPSAPSQPPGQSPSQP
ncbi:MAG TPA: DUF4349 domain-containing protein [Ktedonobacterales bacterium]|nr:DUF4349 domain-containing protein [Ktedonobacterales bacterium]